MQPNSSAGSKPWRNAEDRTKESEVFDMYETILQMILEKKFECVEDAIDYIVLAYKDKKITIEQRNQLIKLI